MSERYERRLARFFDEADYAVMRSPASGSRTDRDQPDVFATTGDESLALEEKYTEDADGTIYVERDEVMSLSRFATKAGATPLIAARFAQTKTFYLFRPRDIETTDAGSLRISKDITDQAIAKLADEDDVEEWKDIEDDETVGRLSPYIAANTGVIGV